MTPTARFSSVVRKAWRSLVVSPCLAIYAAVHRWLEQRVDIADDQADVADVRARAAWQR
jgi:hypothetical protein